MLRLLWECTHVLLPPTCPLNPLLIPPPTSSPAAVKLQGDFGLFYMSYAVAVSVGIILAYFVASFAPSMDAANGILPVSVHSRTHAVDRGEKEADGSHGR